MYKYRSLNARKNGKHKTEKCVLLSFDGHEMLLNDTPTNVRTTNIRTTNVGFNMSQCHNGNTTCSARMMRTYL